ncbi:MAG: NUDIX hydrolase [Patescibacteria group bacterium]
MHRPKPHNHHPLPDHAKKVFQGDRWSVYQWEQKQFDGSVIIFESVKRFDSVIVYPVIDEKIVILEEQQPHWLKASDTIVAGGINNDEDIFDAARRELEEETGMVFKDFYLVNSEQKSKDVQSNVYVFIAKNLIAQKKPKLDAGERTTSREVSFDELITLAKQRKFFHKPTFVDEFIIQDKVETLFDIFRNPEKYSII